MTVNKHFDTMSRTIQNEWYIDFFAGLNCEMWKRAASDEWTEREVEFLLEVLKCPPGGHLLDLPCGFGRHTIELAERGYQMTGIDLSTEYVQSLRLRVEDEKLPVKVLLGDMLTTRLDSSFDGAYCCGNSFGYVDYGGMNAFVGNVSAALKSGARFVINSGMIAESILPNFPKTGHYELGDLTMDINNIHVMEEGCMATELTYTKGEHSETHAFKHYIYTLTEVKRLLATHGLRTIDVYNSTDMGTYQLGDQQIYLVAEKQ